MTYGRFAYLYDELMEDVPYEKWQQVLDFYKHKFQIPGNKLLDVACGTGELSCRFAQQGYDVTGVDLSEDMLAVALSKSVSQGLHIHFIQQNMAELDVPDNFDFITIFCDSLNYLSSEKDIIQTFRGVQNHLTEDGLFLFDIHSVYKMESIFKDQTFTHLGDDICYIWNCFSGEYPFSVEHELTFFVSDSTGVKYERVEEFHQQRTFPVNQYIDWLNQTGFETLQILGDLEQESPIEHSERILFVARKKKS
jgi:SAM-dependent methyltransferase